MVQAPKLLPIPQIRLMAQAELERRRRLGPQPEQFLDDPVGFGRTFLNEQYTADVQRLMESVRDYPVTIAESGNAVGKTHAAARVAVWWFQREGAQVYTTAAPPESNLKNLLWGEIGEIVRKCPELFTGQKVRSLRIERSPKEFVTGVAIPRDANAQAIESRFGGKHAPSLLFVLDEADGIPAAVYKAIESCLSGENSRLLCLYNPRSRGGPLAELKADGVHVVQMSALSHPNVITGENLFPGAVTRDKTLTRIHYWTVPARSAGDVAGFGRWTPPEFLVGVAGTDEKTGGGLPPLEPGERIIVDPQFSYAVLGQYPGVAPDAIYDTWVDDYDEARRHGVPPSGNVRDSADYRPDGGPVLWAIDDGYAGELDPKTGYFSADSHPRVIGMYQVRPDGTICRFDELYQVLEPKPENQINTAAGRPYPAPAFVVIGPGSEQLGGVLSAAGYYKRTCTAKVDASIKHLRDWVSADVNGVRRFTVHPRCRHFRYEMVNYTKSPGGNQPRKAHDHGPDEARYLCWTLRNGL